jgi:hypothetical protein
LEIDREAEHRAELSRRTRGMTDKKLKATIDAKVEKSDEKLDSMTVLMLHYCAGLQHCLDQEEVERQKHSAPADGQWVDSDNVAVFEVDAVRDELSDCLVSAGREVENSLITEQENSVQKDICQAFNDLPESFGNQQRIEADGESGFATVVTQLTDDVECS